MESTDLIFTLLDNQIQKVLFLVLIGQSKVLAFLTLLVLTLSILQSTAVVRSVRLIISEIIMIGQILTKI